MNPQAQLCPNPACRASGKDGHIGIHSRKEKRYRCKVCQRTFSQRHGTVYFGLKHDAALVTTVLTLLAYGCPGEGIVQAYRLDARTIRAWLVRAGQHSQAVHAQLVGQQQWDLQHVQVDELKVRIQGGVVWLTLALMVRTRLWLGMAQDVKRSKAMIVACLRQVARCALCRPLLLAVDGFNMYQTALKKAFRSKHPVGKGGRPIWVEWGNVVLTQVVKARGNRRGHIEQVVSLGRAEVAAHLRCQSRGGQQINTAFIERFNATVRQRLACLSRRSRQSVRQPATLAFSMALMGCVYNFCTDHRGLDQVLYLTPRRRHRVKRTPAMAAGLTDHRWSLEELLTFPVKRDAA